MAPATLFLAVLLATGGGGVVKSDAAAREPAGEDFSWLTAEERRVALVRLAHRDPNLKRDLASAREERREKGWQPPELASYGASFNPSEIPRRRLLLGIRRAIAEVTLDVGPPGVCKSTLQLTDAVSIASGRPILADEVHRTGDVILFAGEDSRRDVEARLAGILQRHGIAPAELGDRLHLVYLAEVDPLAYAFAQMAGDMAVLNENMIRWLAQYPELVAVFIDPIAAWHHVLENDNQAMKILSTGLRRLAVMGDIHVGLDHHVTKASMGDPEAHVGNLAASRGAFLAGDARWMFTLAKLRPDSAASFGVPEEERTRWRRFDPLKASYGPDSGDPRLFYVESVTIPNGESVGVLVERDRVQALAAAADRKEAEASTRRAALADAFARMLLESCPRSVAAAATWLQSRAPELFPAPRGGTLGLTTIRARVPQLIGAGMETPQGRVVISERRGRGASQEIDFAQGRLANA